MYIIDTSILVAELLQKYNDQEDEISKKYLYVYRKIPLMKRVIPDFILNEFELFTTHVIPARYSLQVSEKKQLHDVVASYLRQIIANCTINSPNKQIVKTAFSLYQHPTNDENSNHISFTDSLLLAMASKLQYVIVSTDPQIITYASELNIARLEP